MKLNNNNKKNSGGKKNSPNIMGLISLVVWALIITALLNYFFSIASTANAVEVKFSDFISLVKEDKVEEVKLESNKYTFTLKKEAQQGWLKEYYAEDKDVDPTKAEMPTLYTAPLNYTDLALLFDQHKVAYYTPYQSDSAITNFLLTYLLPMAVMVVAMIFLFRMLGSKMGGGLGSVGKSNAKMYVEKSTGVTFRDVAGQDEAKESLEEIIDFLHNPDKYTAIGAKLPKGALLVGSPGTGKTLLAKAVAGEAKVPFFSISGSDFVEMFVGVGASRVRDLFKEASKMAPCIIFIDEIDTIGKSRDNRMGGNDEREQTLNQLLAELDGFDPSKGVIVLGANLVNEAALRAVRMGRKAVNQNDLLTSFEVVIAGTEKKGTVLTEQEKKLIAYHEVGHALIAARQKGTEPVSKITIVPHTQGALGYTMQTPEEEKFLNSKEELFSRIRILLGGRAAEEVVFHTATTGASNDIERATDLARKMVTMFGMSDTFGIMGLATVKSQYLDGAYGMDCAQDTAALADREIQKILNQCFLDAKNTLLTDREMLDKIASYLLKKETITGQEMMAIIEGRDPALVDNYGTNPNARLENRAQPKADASGVEPPARHIRMMDQLPLPEDKTDTPDHSDDPFSDHSIPDDSDLDDFDDL